MIPIADTTHSRSFPYVNVTIIALNFLVFFYELALSTDTLRGTVGGVPVTSELDRFVWHWGNIPACTLDSLGLRDTVSIAAARLCGAQPHPAWTLFSAMFMHGGWLHILGNMLFLWIFGDNIEDAMGHVAYALFYLVVGAAAAFTHMAFNASDLTPAIGASGAIAGVLGAYILLFPRATVVTLVPLFIFVPVPIPAFLLIGFWFVIQLFSGFASFGTDAVGAGGGVAYFAHIGGFVAGVLLVNFFVWNRARVRRQQYD
jgi:membrane associated rhomboid family serine protease